MYVVYVCMCVCVCVCVLINPCCYYYYSLVLQVAVVGSCQLLLIKILFSLLVSIFMWKWGALVICDSDASLIFRLVW